MPYNAFTMSRVEADFNIQVVSHLDLFGHLPRVAPDPAVLTSISRLRGLANTIGTEKAKSEFLIAPMLAEAWRLGNGRISLLSGVTFNVDPAAELTGVCDFILGHPPQMDYVTRPVLMITEAKNDNLMAGYGQCAAAMVGAQRFNLGRNPTTDTVYGCVSNGAEWKFLRLHGTTLDVDLTEYHITEPDRILGILCHCVGLTPAAPAAA